VGTAPLEARPDGRLSPDRPLSPDAKRCGVTMLDYKEKDVPEGVWECKSEVRNDVCLFNYTPRTSSILYE
jgi:hypothetical protein